MLIEIPKPIYRSAINAFSMLLLCCVFTTSIAQESKQIPGTAKFDRTTLVIKDMQKSLEFWRDVMNYTVKNEPRTLPKTENKYLGWTMEATISFARLYSSEGAGIGLLEVQQEGFGSLYIENQATLYGGVILVHPATDIKAIYERAVKANAVLKPLQKSPTGLSMQMYLKSPSGHVLELYELLPKTTD